MSALSIRVATRDDAATVRAIYAPWIENTSVSFEEVVPSVDEIADRIDAALVRHAWLVAERDDVVVAYAYATTFRGRAAYRWTTETAIYVADSERGQGTGRRIYSALLETLRMQGFVHAIGGMTLPNDASEALHGSLGFEPLGTCRAVGHKRGGWHSVALTQKQLREPPTEPEETRPLAEIVTRPEWAAMIRATIEA